jgi:hypothetical protein
MQKMNNIYESQELEILVHSTDQAHILCFEIFSIKLIKCTRMHLTDQTGSTSAYIAWWPYTL